MLKHIILPAAAAFLFCTLAIAPEPAAAHWASTPAAAVQANTQAINDVIQVQRRRHRGWHGPRGPRWRGHGWRGGVWWGPGPRVYGYAPRCGWVWSPRRGRNVWRCWR